LLVPEVGVEPTLPEGNGILSAFSDFFIDQQSPTIRVFIDPIASAATTTATQRDGRYGGNEARKPRLLAGSGFQRPHIHPSVYQVMTGTAINRARVAEGTQTMRITKARPVRNFLSATATL
jgi:hypothetical protein